MVILSCAVNSRMGVWRNGNSRRIFPQANLFALAQWLSWLERRPVTAKVVGSSPIWVVYLGILAQLGEHLPYKQRVIGSSPIGPIFG